MGQNKMTTTIWALLASLAMGLAPGNSTEDCWDQYVEGEKVVTFCQYIECLCEKAGGIYWTDSLSDSCSDVVKLGCYFSLGQFVCDNRWPRCQFVPLELIDPGYQPDLPGGPSIVDPDQEAAPVGGGSGVPGAIGGGPDATEIVETEPQEQPTITEQPQVLQSNELGTWMPPDQYGHGDDFAYDAFLADAPLEYLEFLLTLQAEGRVRADLPIDLYYRLKQQGDCNGNAMPDTDEVAGGYAEDCDADLMPDECQPDRDGDGWIDNCDPCPSDSLNDADADGRCADDDNCPDTPNPDQTDADGDGIGDACDDDRDGDGVPNNVDNCPDHANADQSDSDGNGRGDPCDHSAPVDEPDTGATPQPPELNVPEQPEPEPNADNTSGDDTPAADTSGDDPQEVMPQIPAVAAPTSCAPASAGAMVMSFAALSLLRTGSRRRYTAHRT